MCLSADGQVQVMHSPSVDRTGKKSMFGWRTPELQE